jgi:carboxyl-terminal processing protease
MSMKTKTAILTASVAVLLFSWVGGLSGVRASSKDGAYPELEVYSEVLSRVRGDYVEEPNIPVVTDGALHGLLESLDADSSYLSPSQFRDYKAHKTDAKGGIGAAVSKRFGYASVISVIPGSPADKAGLQDTDILEAIEGKSTREMSLAEIHNLLAGQPGSTVTVSLVRARKAEPQKVVLTRDVVVIPPVGEKLLDDGIGLIRVDAFNKGMAEDVAAKIKLLQKSGAKKLILDLAELRRGR